MNHAFEDVMHNIINGSQKVSAVGGNLAKNTIQSAQNAGRTALDFAKNIVSDGPPTPYPVASGYGGNTILSNGDSQPGDAQKYKMRNFIATPDEQSKLDALKNNLLKQTAYTPAAVQSIQDTKFIPYGYLNASSPDNLSAGYVNGDGNLYINRNTLENPYYGIETARHELLHNFDDNLYGSSDSEGTLGQSSGFANQLKNETPGWYKDIVDNIIKANPDLYEGDNPQTQDLESYAYYGMYGPDVLLQNPKIADRYTSMYQPADTNYNASPLYPAKEFLRGMSETEDARPIKKTSSKVKLKIKNKNK